MDLVIGSLLVRGINLALWLVVARRLLRRQEPLPLLTRRVVVLVMTFGMAVLFLGALVPFGFPGDVARMVYTVFTAFAALAAFGILTTEDAA